MFESKISIYNSLELFLQRLAKYRSRHTFTHNNDTFNIEVSLSNGSKKFRNTIRIVHVLNAIYIIF